MNIFTGYFGRSSGKGHKAVVTRVHYILSTDDMPKPLCGYKPHEPLCGYKPHESMTFQLCSQTPIGNYAECSECKKNLLTTHVILEDSSGFYAQYYASITSSTNVTDIIPDAGKHHPTRQEAEKWVIRTKKLYTRFWNQVHAPFIEDVKEIKNSELSNAIVMLAQGAILDKGRLAVISKKCVIKVSRDNFKVVSVVKNFMDLAAADDYKMSAGLYDFLEKDMKIHELIQKFKIAR